MIDLQELLARIKPFVLGWIQGGSLYINVKAYGAVGDGSTDDTSAIQSAINAAATGSTVYFPRGIYKVTGLTLATNFVCLRGEAVGVIVKNYGAGAALRITSSYNQIYNLSIFGTGGAYGAGASDTYGVEFIGATNWSMTDVMIRYHGSHGIYVHNNSWVNSCINCEISQNGGDGLNSRSPGGGDQNGNAMQLIASMFSYNAGNGVNWLAAQLSVSGCTIEGNKLAGVRIDTTGTTYRPQGWTVRDSYFESNWLGQIKMVGVSPYQVWGGTISGNYLHSNYAGGGGATALIVGSGPANMIDMVHIQANAYSIVGAVLTAWVNLGSAAAAGCMVEGLYYYAVPTFYTGMGSAQFRPG